MINKPFPVEEKEPMPEPRTAYLRILFLILAALIGSLIIASQLKGPAQARNWLLLSSGIFAILVYDGLLVWVMVLYRQRSGLSKKIVDLKKQFKNDYNNQELAFIQRTSALNRRLDQSRIAIEISRIISQNLDPQILLNQVVDLTQERFNLYYSGVFLVDESGNQAVLQAGSGDAGKIMLGRHHTLAINETSMIGWAIVNKKPRIALDVGKEAIRFKNPDLPLTRSEIALPLISREIVLGALTLQSLEAEAFNADDINVMQGIADITATAMENSKLIQETSKNLAEINSLHRKYLQTAWTEVVNENPDLKFSYEDQPGQDTPTQITPYRFPMTLRGQEIGTLNIETDHGAITPEEMVLIESITNQTALALENARLLEQTQKKVRQELKLNELTTRLSRALDIDQILRIALQELGSLPQVSEVSVYLKSQETDDLDRLTLIEGGQNG